MSEQNAQQQPNSQNQTLCEQALTLLPAYGLGATDADETRLVERALQSCPEVAAELREYQALAGALLHSAPPLQPPAALGDRIMRAATVSSAPTVALPKPSVVAQKPTPTIAQPTIAKRRSFAWGWIAAVAAAIALFVTNGYWFTQVQDLRTQQESITERLNSRNNVIESAAEGELTRIELTSVDSSLSDGLPAAIVLVSPDGTVGAVYTRQLPVLPPEQSYQLWFLDGATGTPVSACVFQVRNTDGQSWLIDVQEPITLDAIAAMGITIEPAGGSPQPTSDPIAAVEV
jgi:anti-sigma-K factor RskA